MREQDHTLLPVALWEPIAKALSTELLYVPLLQEYFLDGCSVEITRLVRAQEYLDFYETERVFTILADGYIKSRNPNTPLRRALVKATFEATINKADNSVKITINSVVVSDDAY